MRKILGYLLILLIFGLSACGGSAAAPVAQATGPAVTGETATSPAPTATATLTPFVETPPSPAAESRTPEPAETEPLDSQAQAEPTPPPPATGTPIPTPSPTSRPQIAPTLAVTGTGTLRDDVPTPPSPIPSPVPTFEVPSETINILLLGNDGELEDGGGSRTDTMIIVTINPEGPTASMVSLPRDLYVYMPTRTMGRLNTALTLGGVDLLKQTILYNFGVPIHYYAQVDFESFKDIVDAFGGVEMAVSCRLRDWRLKSPELDVNLEENWEMFTLEPGVYRMDGDLALWYVRSRLTTSDFDRGRRQQQLLRAMLNQGVNLGLVSQAPALWNTFRDKVETDMDVGRILQLAPMATTIKENGVQDLYLAGKTESWQIPDTGAQVLLPKWEGEGMMGDTIRRLFLPPALNKAERAPVLVEIVNASGNPEMARLAADNLAWYGFAPVIAEEAPAPTAETQVSYYGENFKGSYDWLLSWVMSERQNDIALVSDQPDYAYDYRVVLGADYDPCLPAFYEPVRTTSP